MANIDPQDQAAVNKLYNEYIELLQKVDKLTFAQAKSMADAAKASGNLTGEIAKTNRELQDMVFYTDSIAQGFNETLAELKNQNVQLNIGKAAFKGLSSIASDLNYFQKGISDQTEKQFKLQQEKIKKGREELIGVRDRLGTEIKETGEYKYKKQALLDSLRNVEELTSAQKTLLKELEKEKALLDASNNAIEEGIPILQREYDISKKIYDVRENLGGLATAAAGVVSKYGGSLAQFLNVDEAIDSVKKYNRDLIDGALKSQDTIDKIRAIEEERIQVATRSLKIQKEITQLTKDLNDAANAAAITTNNNTRIAEIQQEIFRQRLAGQTVSQQLLDEELQLRNEITRVQNLSNNYSSINDQLEEKKDKLLKNELKTKQDLAELDEKEAKVKEAAIKSVDTLGNKFKSLGVLIKGLGAGLFKAFTDPTVLLTTLIDLGLKANAQVVELGKSFNLSAKAAENIRQDVAEFARGTGDTFINTDRLLQAQSELSKELGIAVRFSNEELATFAKLTELTGLSAQEAGRLALASKAAGMPTEAYTDSLREAAFFAQQATNTHFSSKEILQDISKLSAGILIKFQGNPKAMAQTVVEAKKLGLSLDQIDKVGESLLNWESSIENELKAELMTGKQLNLERARAAALSGDQLALTREISSQVGSLNDYQKMNVLAQKSLADAFGLSREEMAEMLMKQEAVNKYGKEAANLNKEQLEDMKRQGLSASEYLKKQEQQRTAQAKFQDAMVKLQDIIGNLVAGPVGQLLDAFADMVGFVMKIFGNPVVKFFFNIIAKTAELLSDIASTNFGKVVLGLGAAALFLPKIASGFGTILGSVGNLGKGIKSIFSSDGIKGFFDKIKDGFLESKSLAEKVKETATETATEKITETGTESVTDKLKEKATETIKGKAEEVGDKAGKTVKGGDDGTNIKKKLQNIAEGIKAFANKNVLLGALNLIPTSIGLIAMIPGAIGAKMISLVDGEAFEKAMKGIAKGIKYLGDKNVFAGVGNLVIASLGLTAMVPGAIGAKLISIVDGDAFEKTMKGIAKGIAVFGNKNLLFGAGNLIITAVGLTAMLPGALAAKMISTVDGESFEKAMKGIAKGIVAFGNKNIFAGAGNLTVASIGLITMIPGTIGAKAISTVDSKAFEKAMKGIASGIEAFGKGKILVGSLSMSVASIGLITMLPGVIAAKMIEKSNIGEKFKTSLENISTGIEAFGKGKIVAGSLLMSLASVGLIAMLPGALAAKGIEKLDIGKKFKTSLENIAAGIEAFGKGKILIGSLLMIPATIGLIAMLPGALAAKGIEALNIGTKFSKSMENIAGGINAFGEGVTMASLGKLALGGLALTAFSLAVPGLLLLQLVNGSLINKSLTGIGEGIHNFSKNVKWGDIIKAAGAIAIMGLSLIPAAFAFKMFADVPWDTLAKAGVTLIGLGVAGSILGSMATQILMGAAAIAALGVSLIPAAFALKMFTDVKWEDLGKAGVALVGLGIAGATFGSLMPLMLMGAVAIAALGAALIPFATALNLIALAAPGFSTLFASLQSIDAAKLLAIGPALIGIGAGLASLGAGGVIAAIGSFLGEDPIEKLERLAASGDGLQKTAAALQNLAGALNGVTTALNGIDASKLEALEDFEPGGPSIIEKIGNFITSPIETIGKSINETTPGSAKSETINTGIDLTPLVAAINEVKASVDKLYTKETSINMDGKKVGTTLVQSSYKVA